MAFVVRTDHAAFQWLLSFKEPEGQITRWLVLQLAFRLGVLQYYVGLIGCRSIQLSEEAFFLLGSVETRPIVTAQRRGIRLEL